MNSIMAITLTAEQSRKVFEMLNNPEPSPPLGNMLDDMLSEREIYIDNLNNEIKREVRLKCDKEMLDNGEKDDIKGHTSRAIKRQLRDCRYKQTYYIKKLKEIAKL